MSTADPIAESTPADAWRELRARQRLEEAALLQIEAQILRRALVAAGWRWQPAAELLGVPIGTLRRALERHPELGAARLADLAARPHAHLGTRGMRNGLRTQSSHENQGLAPEPARNLADPGAYAIAHAGAGGSGGAAK